MDNKELSNNSHHQNKGTASFKKHLTSRNGLLVGAALLLLLAAALALYIRNNQGETIEINQTRESNLDQDDYYKTMPVHKLEGTRAGAGMEFRKPYEFIRYDAPFDKAEPPKATSSGNLAEFGERVVTDPTTRTFQSALLARIVDPASGSQSFDYAYFKEAISRMYFQGDSTNSQMIIGPGKAFTSSNIKTGALIYEVQGSMAEGKSSGPIKHIKGEIIQTNGEGGIYYLMVSAIDENWNSNPKTWKAIKDSLKVDK